MADAIIFNAELARKLQSLKSDLGAIHVKQGYKGMGGKAHRRQIFVRFANGEGIDLILDAGRVSLGGVTINRAGSFEITGTVDQTYQEIVERLRSLASPYIPG